MMDIHPIDAGMIGWIIGIFTVLLLIIFIELSEKIRLRNFLKDAGKDKTQDILYTIDNLKIKSLSAYKETNSILFKWKYNDFLDIEKWIKRLRT